MYKPADARADIDFVIYGEQACRTAWTRIRAQLPNPPRSKAGRPYHLHFRAPGQDAYLDPRFITAEDYTADLVTGRLDPQGAEAFNRLEVVDDTTGIFYPARYTLADGSILLSYRLGHSALLQNGDRITSPPLPILTRAGVRYRAVLRYETLSIEHPMDRR